MEQQNQTDQIIQAQQQQQQQQPENTNEAPGTGPDPRLDVTSPDFDAALALETPNLPLPVPDAPVLDNVSKCLPFVEAPDADAQQQQQQQQQQPQPPVSAEAQAKKAKAAALKQRALQATQKAEASVKLGTLPTIMALAAAGPLAVLAKWHAAGQRIYVVTRHASGVRGRAVGTLVAFDKYMNLLLRDVEEAYTVIVKVKRVKQQVLTQGPESQQQPPQQQQPPETQPSDDQQQQQPSGSNAPATRTRTRWCRKQQHRFRQLDQILLKGDNIVLVSGTPPQLQQPPPPSEPAAAAAFPAAAGNKAPVL